MGWTERGMLIVRAEDRSGSAICCSPRRRMGRRRVGANSALTVARQTSPKRQMKSSW